MDITNNKIVRLSIENSLRCIVWIQLSKRIRLFSDDLHWFYSNYLLENNKLIHKMI